MECHLKRVGFHLMIIYDLLPGSFAIDILSLMNMKRITQYDLS